MAKKVYAVKSGYRTGLFYSWEDCQASIKGYSGAVYKGFATEEEAYAYLNGSNLAKDNKGDFVEIKKPISDDVANIFVDGSCVDSNISFGIYIQTKDNSFKFDGAIEASKYNNIKNVAGELFGVIAAVQIANQLGLKRLNIYYDYVGIHSFYTGEWKARGELQQKYRVLLNNFRVLYGVDYKFFHVKGHSGIEGNVVVDKLAKRALNLGHFVDESLILCGKLKPENLYISHI